MVNNQFISLLFYFDRKKYYDDFELIIGSYFKLLNKITNYNEENLLKIVNILISNKFDFIVITSIYERQIRNQLGELGVKSQKIYSAKDYRYKCYK